jgi:4-hydroxy-4-methyl-2-oxoglutarate aldolase
MQKNKERAMDDMTKQFVNTLKKCGTSVIADVFDELGLEPLPLANDLWSTKGRGVSFAGPAYTVSGAMIDSKDKGDRGKLKAIDEMTPGVVAVWAGNGMRGVCCFGDLLATGMKCRGVAGVIVDGGIRDYSYLSELDLPMLVRYRTPAQAIGRWKVTSCMEPVEVSGALRERITVYPLDIIVADDDGAIVVPKNLCEQVAAKARAWDLKDQGARADIMAGMKLLDAVAKHGAL